MTELGKHRLGRHSTAELNPALDDYQLAEALVREAGTLALLMRQAGLEGRQKTSVSDVVTAADHAAEAYVLEQLRRCRPDDGILGEEGASVAGTSGRTWVIDPVDGTYNFLHGSTYWCSAIALKDSSGVLLGAIFQPEEDKLWLGGTARPATLNGERLTTFRPDGVRAPAVPTPRCPNSAPRPTSTPPGSPTRCAPCPGTPPRPPPPRCACSAPAPATSAGWPTANWAAGSSTAARSGTGCPGKAIVLAAGGAADVVRVNGLDWFVAGGTTAVRQLRAALESGSVG